ncbi:MAG TPA: nickel pincer cofactor biosynthesis protein LarC [Sedimentisphaerales bacterium]|nr:nickel pincer cofactor biosynthesis protein LarC [Sedimentisphaerales bacterium]
MRIAYFDCFAGAAGDMIVAAMLDAGLDAQFLKAQLATLGIEGLDVRITETARAGLRAVKFDPVTTEQPEHRNLEQITKIIRESKISKKARETAVAIFDKLAHAEAAVHGKDLNEIHFHEIGALDSIVDIVSACIGLEALGVEKVHCSALSVGGGTVKCDHGIMPVPAPAAAQLLKGIPINPGPMQAELLTPTATAILTTVAEQFGPLPTMKIEAIGYGAGSMNPGEFPNVLRLFLGQTMPEDSADTDTVCLLETNVDDATAELIGFVTEELLELGALDVFSTPIIMKHSRPAVKISVICSPELTSTMEKALFEQGLTLGIRKQLLHRARLVRDFVTVQTEFGPIRMKTGSLNGRIVNAKPEFSDCLAAAKSQNVPVKTVSDAAIASYKKGAPK